VTPQARAQPSAESFGRFLDQGNSSSTIKGTVNMLYTIAVVLIILWLLGLVTSYTMGGLIHVLLVIAIVVVLLRLISGRTAI
jgi:hypothetical protein